MSYGKMSSHNKVWSASMVSSQNSVFPPQHLQSPEEEKEKHLPMTVLADSVFGCSDDIDSSEESYHSKSQTSLFYYEPEQLELPLENPNILLRHHRKMIRRYEQGFERMAMFALKWFYLEHDAQHDEVIGKMLRDIQLLRKLSGYKVI